MPEYGFAGDTPDVEWITRLGVDPVSDWIVISGDHRIRKNKAERAAWIATGTAGTSAGHPSSTAGNSVLGVQTNV
jgi:hypothetical protein